MTYTTCMLCARSAVKLNLLNKGPIMKLRLLTSTFAVLVFSATVGHAQSLQDIYELALENDAQLKAYAAQFRADREQETLAKSALLPQVGASYDYNETETSTVANSLVGLDANGNGITRSKFRDFFAKTRNFFFFNSLNNVCHIYFLFFKSCSCSPNASWSSPDSSIVNS